MIGVGVIGFGYWGPNLARNFHESGVSRLLRVCDLSKDRADLATRRYPTARVSTDPNDLLRDPQVDAVAIATPVSTHYELAMAALDAGKHVLVEKPIAASSEQAIRLIDKAASKRLVLMVDHTFVYSGAVRKSRELIKSGQLGTPLYFDSQRINLGLFQHDVNVIWDLAVHDLSILDSLIQLRPVRVSASGARHMSGQQENIAFLTLFFDSSFIAHINVNWLAPVKIRRSIIGGTEKMLVYDDLDVAEPVRIYDKGLVVNSGQEAVYEMLISYRWGDMWAPRVDRSEPLAVETRHFVDCINRSVDPQTDGKAGLRVVRALEAASKSLADGGRPVQIQSD